MPFNIITFTFGMMTLYFLALMRISAGFNKLNHWMYD